MQIHDRANGVRAWSMINGSFIWEGPKKNNYMAPHSWNNVAHLELIFPFKCTMPSWSTHLQKSETTYAHYKLSALIVLFPALLPFAPFVQYILRYIFLFKIYTYQLHKICASIKVFVFYLQHIVAKKGATLLM